MAVLLATGCNHGEQARDKLVALGALGTKTAFAPQHGRTQGALGTIIGRLDTRHTHKGPQGLPFGEQLGTDPRNAIPTNRLPLLQQATQFVLHGRKKLLEARSIHLALAPSVPGIKDEVDLVEHCLSPGPVWPSVVIQGQDVALNVRPAELAFVEREAVVGFGAVTPHHAPKLRSQQGVEALSTAAEAHHKESRDGGNGNPQPAPRPRFLPTRLVDVGDGLPRHDRLDGASDPFERPAHFLLERDDTAEADGEAKAIAQELGRLTIADAIARVEQTNECGDTRAKGTRRHISRALGCDQRGALGTADAMVVVLGHYGPERRDVPDLLTTRRRSIGQILGQGLLTLRASLWMMGDDFINLLGRQRFAVVALVPRLPTAWTTARRARGARWRIGSISRGRFGGVL